MGMRALLDPSSSNSSNATFLGRLLVEAEL
jgi:hypothetical protein